MKARYSKHYRISEEDLLWLAARVEELGRAVHAILFGAHCRVGGSYSDGLTALAGFLASAFLGSRDTGAEGSYFVLRCNACY